MSRVIERICSELSQRVPAQLVAVPVRTKVGVWHRRIIKVGKGELARPLVTVVSPPAEWPVTVEYHHADPSITTGYKYEFGRDPNIVHADNPPTIDNETELAKILDALLALPETQRTLAAAAIE